jgi:hypothetical protein
VKHSKAFEIYSDLSVKSLDNAGIDRQFGRFCGGTKPQTLSLLLRHCHY